MSKVIIIGAGGVGTVVAHKVAKNNRIFDEVILASRTVEKCDVISFNIGVKYGNKRIRTAQVDANNISELVALFKKFQPETVINVALPYQDLSIMSACLEAGVNYVDTANYEPVDEAKFEYKLQWAYHDHFKDAGLTAILGCGFDPGACSVFAAYAAKHYFSRLDALDIIDCNAGDHGKAFATNFNPEINIREITQKARYFENGKWITSEPHEIHRPLPYPNIGVKESYLIYHEELESLVKNFPTLKRARFWMTFGEDYLTHLRVIRNIGMAGIEPVLFNGVEIVPLQFLKALLPDPGKLGENYTGETSIGCYIKGLDVIGEERTVYIYNNCKHKAAFFETGAQAVSYSTGVPATIGAMLIANGVWRKPGVFNVEELDPDPFMELMETQGLPWRIDINGDYPFE